MNWLLVMMIWMATPGMSTNLFWTSLERPSVPLPAGDFSAAEKYLRANGLALKRWAGAGFGEPAGKPPGIWLIVAGPKKEETDAASLAQLDDYLKAGGSVLILIRSDAADAGIRSLLRHYRLALNPEPVPAKSQLFNSGLFEGLRFQSPKTRLLDAAEEALSEMALVPNDLKQPAASGPGTDRPGFRMVLGKRGAGRIAFVTGAEAFASPNQAQETKNNNLEILLYVCRHLIAP